MVKNATNELPVKGNNALHCLRDQVLAFAKALFDGETCDLPIYIEEITAQYQRCRRLGFRQDTILTYIANDPHYTVNSGFEYAQIPLPFGEAQS